MNESKYFSVPVIGNLTVQASCVEEAKLKVKRCLAGDSYAISTEDILCALEIDTAGITEL